MHSDYARQGMKIYRTHPEAGVMELIALAMTLPAAELILECLQYTERTLDALDRAGGRSVTVMEEASDG